MRLTGVTATDLSNPAWGEAPIHPDWILAGSPRARAATLAQSADGFSLTAAWDCTAGRFRWHYDLDETVHILQGSVTITDARGHSHTLVAGDVALFRAGTTLTWVVPDYVRKLAFLHRPVPRTAGLALRVLGRLRRMVGRGLPARGSLRPAT